MDFSRLELLRKSRGVSAAHLCRIVGKEKYYIRDCRAKSVSIPNEYIEAWASELCSSVAYLLGETDDPSPKTKKDPATREDDGVSDLDRELISLLGQCQFGSEDYRRMAVLLKLSQEELRRVLDFAEGVLAARAD